MADGGRGSARWPMPADRADRIAAFLDSAGWRGAARTPLAGDASFRRYERLTLGPRRAVLMDAPPPHNDTRPFAAIARWLRARGYSAPRICAGDEESGLLLLEDLGDLTFSRALDGGADPVRLYGAAADLLADLRRHAPPDWAAPYDEAAFLAEADLLIDWFLPAMGAPGGDALRAGHHAAWRAVLPLAAHAPPALVLRDYHADNLVWLPDRAGAARVGLLDFQDALAGPPAYDLASLLEDARRDVPPPLAEAVTARYLAAMPGIDPRAFRAARGVLAAQRNAKIVGIFTRLWRRDGKPGYLRLLPRVWRLLESGLARPALAPVRAWFDAHVPPPLRRAPRP